MNNKCTICDIINGKLKSFIIYEDNLFLAFLDRVCKVSQSIEHLHIHIVPRNKGNGLKGFFWPRSKYQSEEQMLEVQLAIKNAITKGGKK